MPRSSNIAANQPVSVDVFDHLELRSYLAAYYEVRKAAGRGFSYRWFSRKAGLKAPNHLKRVIDGERPLTAASAVRYAEAIGLEGDSYAYFLDLAAFSRMKTTKERNAAYARLTRYRRSQQSHALEHAQALYHSTWYIPAVRELVDTVGFKEDPTWVAQSLVPSITRAEAVRALELLQTLGLIHRDERGRLVQSDSVVTTGPEAAGLNIANYHRSMLQRAAESIDLVDRERRDLSSLTFTCNEAVLVEIKSRLVAFRRELIGLIGECKGADRVAQLNMQLFPLSQTSRS